MFYTTDGSEPTQSSSKIGYSSSASVTINANMNLRIKSGVYFQQNYSGFTEIVINCDYIVKPATPTASIASGSTVDAGSKVTLSCETNGATIHYTTDGSNPTASSMVYTDPIVLDETCLLKAIAIKDGCQNSDVAVFNYVVVGPIINSASISPQYHILGRVAASGAKISIDGLDFKAGNKVKLKVLNSSNNTVLEKDIARNDSSNEFDIVLTKDELNGFAVGNYTVQLSTYTKKNIVSDQKELSYQVMKLLPQVDKLSLSQKGHSKKNVPEELKITISGKDFDDSFKCYVVFAKKGSDVKYTYPQNGQLLSSVNTNLFEITIPKSFLEKMEVGRYLVSTIVEME